MLSFFSLCPILLLQYHIHSGLHQRYLLDFQLWLWERCQIQVYRLCWRTRAQGWLSFYSGWRRRYSWSSSHSASWCRSWSRLKICNQLPHWKWVLNLYLLQKTINGIFEFLGVLDLLRTKGPYWIDNIMAPITYWGVGGTVTNLNWGSQPDGQQIGVSVLWRSAVPACTN